jgi:predicted GNAT family N-acyltransferase
MHQYHTQPIVFASPEYDEAVALRYEVLRKPLGLVFTQEELNAENNEFHFGCYNTEQILCGCLTYHIYSATTLKMRQVAVKSALQGIGIGRLLVENTENWASNAGWKTIILHARLSAVPFYEKLKYVVDGDEFEEVGVPHYKMWKKLKEI